MKGWQHVPRAVRRKLIETVVKDDPAFVRAELVKLRQARIKAAEELAVLDEAIEDTEKLLGEISA